MMNEKFILSLMDKFNNSKIDELDLNDGTMRLVLRRGLPGGISSYPGAYEATDPGLADSGRSAGSGAVGGKPIHLGMPASASSHGSGEEITSPIVATYYSAPGPDAPPFVIPGSKVKAGQTLCILEAMKMMNHLEADFDCEIFEIHAANGDFVEYDQPLFSVKRL